MAVFKSFSERQKERLGQFSDVYVYDDVPLKLRNQIINIWDKFMGEGHSGSGKYPAKFLAFHRPSPVVRSPMAIAHPSYHGGFSAQGSKELHACRPVRSNRHPQAVFLQVL